MHRRDNEEDYDILEHLANARFRAYGPVIVGLIIFVLPILAVATWVDPSPFKIIILIVWIYMLYAAIKRGEKSRKFYGED